MPTLIITMPPEAQFRSHGDSSPVRVTRAPRGRQARGRSPRPGQAGRSGHRSLTGGGTEGNERLTTLTGLILIVLLAALGITILRIGQLLWLHLFLGLLLLGPVALKMGSTGYRFMRYYTGDPTYRRKGPPAPVLRILAPAVIGLTLIVFLSGVALLLIGPSSRHYLLLLHKASFILWLGAMAVHVFGHLPELTRMLRIAGSSRDEMIALRGGPARPAGRAAGPAPAEHVDGGAGRWLSMGSALVAGLVLAIALIPQFGVWTHAVFAFGH